MNLYYVWLWLWFLVIKGKKAFIFKEDISWDDRSPWRVKKFLYMSKKKIIYYQTIQLLVISWSPVLLRVSTHIYIHIYIQSIHMQSTYKVSTYIYIHLQDPRYRRVALQQSALTDWFEGIKKIIRNPPWDWKSWLSPNQFQNPLL